MQEVAYSPKPDFNVLTLCAQIESLGAERYTPAGDLALDLVLAHQSIQNEMGIARQVKLALKAVAFGEVAHQLRQTDMRCLYRFQGFLASKGRTQQVILHIGSFEKVERHQEF